MNNEYPPLNHELDIWTPMITVVAMVMMIGMVAMMARSFAGGE